VIHTLHFPSGHRINTLSADEPLKWLETLKGYKVEPETLDPEFEKAPSRSLMIMARLEEWNECLL
jgi:hypothetical protein